MRRKITMVGVVAAAVLILGACGSGQENDVSGESLTGIYPDGSTPTYSGEKLKLTVDGEEIIIAMYDNTAVDAFLERLPLEDLSLTFLG